MRKIELYRIVMGPDLWTITSADKVQTYDAGSGSEFYIPTALGRGGHEQKNELSKASLEVSLPIDHEISVKLLTAYSDEVMGLTLFTDTDGMVEVSWKGRLASIKPGDSNLTLNFESVFTSLRRPGLRARFQKSCRHALYGRGCNLDPADFAVASTLSAITGTTLTVPEAALEADGYFHGGMVAAQDGTLSFVVGHTGDQVTLQRVSYALATEFALNGVGMAITLYPGCDHSRSTCLNKFANHLNYGGFDWIPNKNPMGGSSIV